MKTLYLMRHAKSSWGDISTADFERPLNARGINTAPLMGKLMAGRRLTPGVIFSSPAQRARQTVLLVSEAARFKAEVIFDDRIYEASPMRLLAVIAAIANELSSAMLVGHNPGIEGFIWHLTGTLETMPTCALAILQLNINAWADIRENCGLVADVSRPKHEDL
jgi:phosphohistidine phosphatase